MDKSIKRGSFIDFFAYTPARLDLLKQLGSSSKASSQLPGSNIWISTSAPAIPDPALVLRSKANLASGFYFYLSRLNVSKSKAHLSHDRVLWWSWLNTKFHDNDRALLYFACNFALKHHASDHWAVHGRRECKPSLQRCQYELLQRRPRVQKIPPATRIAGTVKGSLSSDIRRPAPQNALPGLLSKRKLSMLCPPNAPPRLACLASSRATLVIPP